MLVTSQLSTSSYHIILSNIHIFTLQIIKFSVWRRLPVLDSGKPVAYLRKLIFVGCSDSRSTSVTGAASAPCWHAACIKVSVLAKWVRADDAGGGRGGHG